MRKPLNNTCNTSGIIFPVLIAKIPDHFGQDKFSLLININKMQTQAKIYLCTIATMCSFFVEKNCKHILHFQIIPFWKKKHYYFMVHSVGEILHHWNLTNNVFKNLQKNIKTSPRKWLWSPWLMRVFSTHSWNWKRLSCQTHLSVGHAFHAMKLTCSEEQWMKLDSPAMVGVPPIISVVCSKITSSGFVNEPHHGFNLIWKKKLLQF